MIVFLSLWSIVWRALHDLYCLYSSSLKLNQSARGHFVTLIESGVHLSTCNHGVIYVKTDHDWIRNRNKSVGVKTIGNSFERT